MEPEITVERRLAQIVCERLTQAKFLDAKTVDFKAVIDTLEHDFNFLSDWGCLKIDDILLEH